SRKSAPVRSSRLKEDLPMPGLQSQVRERIQDWRGRLLDCNSVECSRTRRAWHRISDGAGSVHLHGVRYCFPRCFEEELQRRFEQVRVLPSSIPRSSHRLPLGLLMLSRGDLSDLQLRAALSAQQQNGTGRIGEWIQKLGYAREPQVTAALAVQWSCPILRTLPQPV